MQTKAIAESNEVEMAETLPESVNEALAACVPFMPPDALAHLVDYWSDEKRTLSLAQTALDEGASNCGVMELAEYVASRERRSSQVIGQWHQAGLVIDPIVFYPSFYPQTQTSVDQHEKLDEAVKAVETLIRA